MHLFIEPDTKIFRIKYLLSEICDDVFRDPNNPRNIINHSTYNKGFDWYFPNFATNSNSKIGSIFYNEDIVKGLLSDSNYRQNFLKLTRHYFECAGLMNDGNAINYDGIKSHMVRLDKIIQSYRILLCYCDDVASVDGEEIRQFKRELQETYKQVYRRFYSEQDHYKLPISSYHKRSIAMIFDSDLRTMAFSYPSLRNQMMRRPLAIKTYNSSSKESYRDIEEAISVPPAPPVPAPPAPPAPARSARPSAPPAPARPAHPARPPAPARPAPQPPAPAPPAPPPTDHHSQVKDRAKGLIYGQAIFDAIGLTTEFMGINQAKLVMSISGVASARDDSKEGFNLTVNKAQIAKFLEDPYQIRKNLTCDPDITQMENHQIHKHLIRYYCTTPNKQGDYRSMMNSDQDKHLQWRQVVPKGSFTDDTDQAVLKFEALKDANGDITQAVKLYAGYLKNWKNHGQEEFFGKWSFGLGGNTKEVIEDEGFLFDPISSSKATWRKNATKSLNPYFPQANGALMSSSYVLQFFPDSLELAQQATAEFAKVTHYDPLVSAHCVAYVTMLYRLMHHQGEVTDDIYKGFLDESYQAGKNFFDKRKDEYRKVYDPRNFGGVALEDKLNFWDNQMYKAIYGEISYHKGESEKFTTWEDLQLVNPYIKLGGVSKQRQQYDDIGMSHRALSAGFFGLRKLREYEGSLGKEHALARVCIEMTAQGGDADTNGTIVGSLCGAYVGFGNISKSLVDGLGAGDRGDKIGKVRGSDGKAMEIQEKKLLSKITAIAQQKIASQSYQEITVGKYKLVTPYFDENNQSLSKRIREPDTFSHKRGLAFRYQSQSAASSSASSSAQPANFDQACKVIAENLVKATQSARITDKNLVLRAIRIAQKFGGVSNFFDDNGNKITDKQQILQTIRANTDLKEQNLTEDELNKITKLSFYFQKENESSSILTGRLNGSMVGLRLAYVSDNVIARFLIGRHLKTCSKVINKFLKKYSDLKNNS